MMDKEIELLELSDRSSIKKIIDNFTEKFQYQKELYSSFYNKLYTLLSSIEDDICKELIIQMKVLKLVQIGKRLMIQR